MTDNPKAVTSIEDLLQRIQKESGADPNTLPVGNQIVWYAPADTTRDATASRDPLVIRMLQPYPLFPSHNVIGIFHDEEEFRVYTVSGGKAPSDKPQDVNPRCVHLSKRGPVYFVEIMPTIEAFVTAIATDWSVVAYDMTPLERARVLIADFVRENEAAPIQDRLTVEAVADAIENGDYEDEGEEDEDDKETPPSPPAPTVTPAPGVQ